MKFSGPSPIRVHLRPSAANSIRSSSVFICVYLWLKLCLEPIGGSPLANRLVVDKLPSGWFVERVYGLRPLKYVCDCTPLASHLLGRNVGLFRVRPGKSKQGPIAQS
jgi:hypothetical protein